MDETEAAMLGSSFTLVSFAIAFSASLPLSFLFDDRFRNVGTNCVKAGWRHLVCGAPAPANNRTLCCWCLVLLIMPAEWHKILGSIVRVDSRLTHVEIEMRIMIVRSVGISSTCRQISFVGAIVIGNRIVS